MAIVNGYCALADLKGRLGIADTDDDAKLEQVIGGVSRLIDQHCRRRFWTNAQDETRYYTATNAWTTWTDDIVSVTELATDNAVGGNYSTIWPASSYDLLPANAAAHGEPYMQIRITPFGEKRFPLHVNGVRVIGRFGVPTGSGWLEVVREACLIQAARIFRRRDAVFGVAGSAEMGQQLVIPKLDPDVEFMLRPPIRRIVTG